MVVDVKITSAMVLPVALSLQMIMVIFEVTSSLVVALPAALQSQFDQFGDKQYAVRPIRNSY